ncbi:MAG: catalase-related domain-containing protein [Desulfocurvibacter africanus]
MARHTDIIERQLAHFEKADPAYGAGVRAALAEIHGAMAEAMA